MIHFSYSFCMMMLHSLWQAAFILFLFVTADIFFYKNNAPLTKRNFLYIALLTQFILSAFTFSIYFFNIQRTENIAALSQYISAFIGIENIQIVTQWTFSLYISIITYKLIFALFTWVQFQKQYKTGLQKPAIDLKLFTEMKAHHFGIKRKVKLWLSNSIHTPVTFGFFKPIILLPVALVNNISTRQAETLILHELTHIRANDYLLNWFLILAETIFFFNPFVNSLCKKIKLEREKNCDIHVISFEYSPALYAETLLQAEKIKQLVPDFQLAAVNSKKNLLYRIRFFTNDKVLNKPLQFNIVAPLIGLILVLMLSTAVLFQSGNATFQANTAAGIPYLPVSNYSISDADFGNNFLPTTKTPVKDFNQTKETEKQLIINKITKSDPVVKPKTVADIAKGKLNQPDEIIVVPVATKENDAARQIIIKEEGSGSASVKIYYLRFENGAWILQPEWVITAKEINTDSLHLKTDSLHKGVNRTIPAQQ